MLQDLKKSLKKPLLGGGRKSAVNEASENCDFRQGSTKKVGDSIAMNFFSGLALYVLVTMTTQSYVWLCVWERALSLFWSGGGFLWEQDAFTMCGFPVWPSLEQNSDNYTR